ncbi:hypothetical protein HYZ64_03275 [Candidatus Berkelbacteria bacterium]|nr:hypothetical protein [Candidatus Berkelbacteria bacterium]
MTSDPYNLSREFDIKKLTDEKRGEWRIRSGNYRIRYDIAENRILVHEVFDRTPPVTAPGAAYCGIKLDLTQKGRQGATRENQGTGQTIANGIDLSRIKEKSEVNAARVT